ncbi:hypothetical protein F5888DRAFT_1925899 [Russula emetica]|nr:hypothetical protein F5888DRAFT_1925899 [Russula emetica]
MTTTVANIFTRIPEVTIKSLSIAMGIRQPGFQLLSLSTPAHAHQPCLLPDQVRIYCWVYAPFVLATIVPYSLERARSQPHRHATRSTSKNAQWTYSRIPRRYSNRDPFPHAGEAITDRGRQKIY